MKCSFSDDCDKEAVGEAYFAGIDRWDPFCKAHFKSFKQGGMKVRLLSEKKPFVKVLCHTCKGKRFIEETEFETKEPVKVLCPECEGLGYVLYEPFQTLGETGTEK